MRTPQTGQRQFAEWIRRYLPREIAGTAAELGCAASAYLLAAAVAHDAQAGLLDAKKIYEKSKVRITHIGHKWVRRPPVVNDPCIGKSHGLPIPMRIRVDPAATGFPAGIGSIVHRALFSSCPPFTFKVTFACANPGIMGRSQYANPASIWYNVFFGCYEIEVSKAAWGRPFGYHLVSGVLQVRHEDIVRIGKADWNHFSNQLYGVPADAIAPHDVVNMSQVRPPPVVRMRVGSRGWDLIDLPGLQVVGPIRANGDTRDFSDMVALVGAAWRFVFGRYDTRVDAPTSFAGTSMWVRLYSSYREEVKPGGEAVYKTHMFGGTIHEGYRDVAENDRFLNLQMRAVEQIMLKDPTLGFP
jgi:hypothetical protein